MDVCYVFVIISVILSVNCEKHYGNPDKMENDEKHNKTMPAVACVPSSDLLVPIYGICLIAFSMVIMLFVIIYLSITLASIKSKIYNNNDQGRFFRENSNGHSYDNVHMREKYRNNESTLTVNSGVIEVNRCSEPETPTRTDNGIKIYVTKPPGSVPMMHKKQMEEIIQHVLNRSKKTASTSLRELNELQNEVNNAPMVEAGCEKTKEVNNVQNNEDDVKHNRENVEEAEIGGKNNNETNEDTNAVNNETPKEEVANNDEVKENKIEKERNRPESVTEMEVYDTVPTPKRTTLGSDDVDSMPLYDCPPLEKPPVYDCPPADSTPLYDCPPADSTPLYDCPPADSTPLYDCPPADSTPLYDCPPTDNMPVYDSLPNQSNNILILDYDADYLMPLTRRNTNTYINARTSKK